MSGLDLALNSGSAWRGGAAFLECSGCKGRLEQRGVEKIGSSVLEAL